jgi:nucleoside-diphosphate-sugar epimerase
MTNTADGGGHRPAEASKPRILVTGATGFIGTNLVPVLSDAGFDVVPFSLRGWRDEPFPAGIDAVVNLAGKAHDLDGKSSPDEYFRINTELAERAYSAFLASDAHTFVQLSSVAAVNEESVAGVLDESAAPHPLTPYGRSKLAAERLLLAVEQPEGKRVVILRPTMVHGPGDPGNLGLLFGLISRGVPYPLDAFSGKRTFVSVGNLSWAIAQILADAPDVGRASDAGATPGTGNAHRVPTGVYNVADDDPISTADLVDIIGEVTGRRVRHLRVPAPLVRFGARIGDVVPVVPLTSRRLAKLTEDFVVSGDRLRDALGVDRMPTPTVDGLRSSIRALADARNRRTTAVRSESKADDR